MYDKFLFQYLACITFYTLCYVDVVFWYIMCAAVGIYYVFIDLDIEGVWHCLLVVLMYLGVVPYLLWIFS